MKRLSPIFLFVVLLTTACNYLSRKVAINDKSEIFYKGYGVAKGDAKKLGNFLLDQGYFDTLVTRSVQLVKDDGVYIVKFVVDEEKLKEDKEDVLLGFRVWKMWIEDYVFIGSKVKLILTDSQLRDIQDVGSFTPIEKAELNGEY